MSKLARLIESARLLEPSALKELKEISVRHLHEAWGGGKGDPDALRKWYNDGADGGIDWGQPGDFDACVKIASKYIDDAEGFCNERHQDATGAPPGHAPGEAKDKS